MSPANGTSTVNGRRRKFVDDNVTQFCRRRASTSPILKICDNYLREKTCPTVDESTTTPHHIRKFKSPTDDGHYYSFTCNCIIRDMEINAPTTYEYCEIVTKGVRRRRLQSKNSKLKFLSNSTIKRTRYWSSNIVAMCLERITFYFILLIKHLLYDRILLAIDYKTAQLIVGYFFIHFLPITDACATRPSPKPRPPRPIWAPGDIKVERQNCSEDYVNLFCLNGGTCFTSKFSDSWALGCECAPGWYGLRCDYLEFAPVQQRIETASIAGGVTVLVILIVFTLFVVYVYRRRNKIRASGRHVSPSIFDEPDFQATNLPVRPFSIRRTHMVPCVVHSKNEIAVASPTSTSTSDPMEDRHSQSISHNVPRSVP